MRRRPTPRGRTRPPPDEPWGNRGRWCAPPSPPVPHPRTLDLLAWPSGTPWSPARVPLPGLDGPAPRPSAERGRRGTVAGAARRHACPWPRTSSPQRRVRPPRAPPWSPGRPPPPARTAPPGDRGRTPSGSAGRGGPPTTAMDGARWPPGSPARAASASSCTGCSRHRAGPTTRGAGPS
jgi:hypothetical protein